MPREVAVSILRGRRRAACAATVALVAVLAGSASAGAPERPRDGRIVFSTGGALGSRIISAPLGAGSPRSLVRGLPGSPVLALSPDGTLIAFVRDGRHSIWLIRVDGSGLRRLVHGSHPTWSSDGRQLAFRGRAGVMAIRRDGSGLRHVVQAETALPVWSPKGAWIAYTTPVGDLWIVRPNGTGLRRLAKTETSWPLGSPSQANFSWSPDGLRLAYAANEGGRTNIFTISVEGGPPSRLTAGPDEEGAPQWSPDGSRIAFWREGEGTAVVPADGSAPARHVTRGTAPSWSPDSSRLAVVRGGHVWVARADGRAVRRVSRGEGVHLSVNGRPAWTRNGRRILFSRESWLAGELMTVSPAGGGRRRLTHNRIGEIEPAWSPDGRMVAFTGVLDEGRTDEQEIYVVRGDGTHLRRLTHRRGPDSQPAWSPDGKRIVFVRRTSSEAALYVVPARGGKARRIKRLRPGIGNPSWAPARWIAINGIELVTGTGRTAGTVTRPPENGSDTEPDWAPDGRRFAFVRTITGCGRQCEYTDLAVGRLGSSRVRLIARNLTLAAPTWSPDGTLIGAVIPESGRLVIMRPDGSGRRVLAIGLWDGTQIDWGPAR